MFTSKIDKNNALEDKWSLFNLILRTHITERNLTLKDFDMIPPFLFTTYNICLQLLSHGQTWGSIVKNYINGPYKAV